MSGFKVPVRMRLCFCCCWFSCSLIWSFPRGWRWIGSFCWFCGSKGLISSFISAQKQFISGWRKNLFLVRGLEWGRKGKVHSILRIYGFCFIFARDRLIDKEGHAIEVYFIFFQAQFSNLTGIHLPHTLFLQFFQLFWLFAQNAEIYLNFLEHCKLFQNLPSVNTQRRDCISLNFGFLHLEHGKVIFVHI